MRFPEHGRDWPALEAEMNDYAAGDIDWRHGRTPLYVFFATDEIYEVGRAAYMKFFTENALGGKRAFYSVGLMEEEVIAMALDLFRGGADATGHMTSGGSESIVLAVKAARDWFRARRGRSGAGARPNMVLPRSAHPAFDKAADAMDLEVRRVPLGADYRADPAAMAEAADAGTFLIVASAPSFPHGTVDPVAALGRLALERDLWLHVDACVGGYLAPFVARLGRAVPHFDFTVPGVRSLSADLHKYGFCPKPASTLFYREREDHERSRFDFEDWPSGRFSTATLVGTRPAGGVAGAWAVLNHLGIEGYMRLAEQLMATRDTYVAGIERIEGYRLIGRPDLTIVNFANQRADAYLVAEEMDRRGWLTGLTRDPKGLHLMLSMKHAEALDNYLLDLEDCTRKVSGSNRRASVTARY